MKNRDRIILKKLMTIILIIVSIFTSLAILSIIGLLAFGGPGNEYETDSSPANELFMEGLVDD